MSPRAGLVAVVAAVALVSGCQSTASTPAASGETPTPTRSQPGTSTPAPTPTVPTLGHEYSKSGRYADARITALSYETDVYPSEREGYETAALEARVCIDKLTAEFGGDAMSISWQPWTLRFDGGFIIESAGSYLSDQMPGPMYPIGRQIREGECARGWIPFEVPEDSAPQRVTYMPGSGAYQLEWRVE